MILSPERLLAIEGAAKEVLLALDAFRLPVNPLDVARQEGICLAPGSYDGCFDGRIEYHRGAAKFILFYADEAAAGGEGRVRFTVAHELGHYYLEEHRQYLLSGVWHGSRTGFVSDNRVEREADQFAAALLMPADLFCQEVRRLPGRTCDLRGLSQLAQMLRTSLTSTAIRYCQCDIEACSVVLSRGGRVIHHTPSSDMAYLGLRFIPYGSPVPATSRTATLLKHTGGAAPPVEGEVDAGVWYDGGEGRLWEEALHLGSTGLTLTFLACQEPEEGEGDE